jgi:CRP/FNR family cyclic AMP-dependent transcriptional regulator
MATPAQHDELRVPKGTVIFRQGDAGDEMFVISAGRVRLTLGGEGHEKEIAVLGPGDFFGELSLLSGMARTATAEAIEDSTVLAISRDVFGMMVQDDLDIVFRMFNIQGQRLRQTNEPIQQLSQRLGQIRILAHCLKRLLAANGQFPLGIDVDGLAWELHISSEAVHATLADLERHGAGALQNRRWTIGGREQVDKLIDTLCRYSEGRNEPGQGSP